MNSPVPGCITVTDTPGSQKPRLYWVSGLGGKTSGEGHVEISAMPPQTSLQPRERLRTNAAFWGGVGDTEG